MTATVGQPWLRRARSNRARALAKDGHVRVTEAPTEVFSEASGAVTTTVGATVYDGPGLIGNMPRTSDNDGEAGERPRHRNLRRLRLPHGPDADAVELGHVVTVVDSADATLIGQTFTVVDDATTGVQVTRIFTVERFDPTRRR
jgi:hypothetical protein